MTTQFKRTTDLKRSSGLRLSTPVRSLVERVALSAGLTYSDAIRLLVEEALAARAGEMSHAARSVDEVVKVVNLLQVSTKLFTDALYRDEDVMREIRNETARILHSLSGWPVANARQVSEMQQKIDALQWQVEKVLDLLAEQAQAGEASTIAAKIENIERYLGEMSGGSYGIWHWKDLDGG